LRGRVFHCAAKPWSAAHAAAERHEVMKAFGEKTRGTLFSLSLFCFFVSCLVLKQLELALAPASKDHDHTPYMGTACVGLLYRLKCDWLRKLFDYPDPKVQIRWGDATDWI
jgi:hypothetical protein